MIASRTIFDASSVELETDLLNAGACCRRQSATEGIARSVFVFQAKELLDDVPGFSFGGIGQMQVDHRGLQAGVAEVLLDDSQRDSGLEQMGGVRMPQGMNGHSFLKVQFFGDLSHRLLHRGDRDRSFGKRRLLVVSPFGRKQKVGVTMSAPVLSQSVECFTWEGNVPIFGSFAAMNVHHHSLRIDVGDLQVPSFVESQSKGIGGPEVGGDSRDVGRGDDLMNLIDGQNLGQGFDVLQLHGGEGFPRPFAGSGVEELDSGESDSHGTVRELFFILDEQEVFSQLSFRDPIGSSLAMIRELPDGSKVSVDGSFGETGKLEIFEHFLIECSVEEF